MRYIIILFVPMFLLVPAYCFTLYKKYSAGKELVAEAKPFEQLSEDVGMTILVLGDSSGVGVGAKMSEESVAGRLFREVEATYLENGAVSGAQVRDLGEQLKELKRDQYDYILVQIGGNDIVRFHDPVEEASRLKDVLSSLPQHKRLIVLSAGNLGGTDFFPFFMNPSYRKLTLRYHEEFERVVREVQGEYVNLYKEKDVDPFVSEPGVYLAADGFHPSGGGYRVWFETLREQVDLD